MKVALPATLAKLEVVVGVVAEVEVVVAVETK